MTSKRGKPSNWPYVFLNHGLWGYRDEIRSAQWYVVFERDVPEGERERLLQDRPPPAAGPARWAGGRILRFESPPDRFFDSHVWRAYGPGAAGRGDEDDGAATSDEDLGDDEDFELTKREAQAFVGALDAWLEQVHGRHPIALVIAWNGDANDPWSGWSVERVPERIVPILREIVAAGRAASDETRQPDAPEQLAGWVVWEALASYFEDHEPKDLDAPARAAMEEAARGAKGHDPSLDWKLDRLLRKLAKASGAA